MAGKMDAGASRGTVYIIRSYTCVLIDLPVLIFTVTSPGRVIVGVQYYCECAVELFTAVI